MLCSLLSMTEVIMLEITSSLQKSSRKLKRSMVVLAHVAVLRETSYETSSGGRRPRVLERLSALKLHTDSFPARFSTIRRRVRASRGSSKNGRGQNSAAGTRSNQGENTGENRVKARDFTRFWASPERG